MVSVLSEWAIAPAMRTGGEVRMKESLKSKLIRSIREKRIKAVKWIIRKCVRKLDVLQYGGFLAYSWGYDDEIDYHVIKERSTNEFYQYGTMVTYYGQEGR